MAQKRIGHPPSDDTMTDRIFARVSKETIEKLDECTRGFGTSRFDVVREGINMVHDQLKKQNRNGDLPLRVYAVSRYAYCRPCLH